MSDSVRPHRRQPTRLPRPWDSSGKNTGMGCHFLLRCMKVKSEREVAQSCPAAFQAPPPMGFSRQEYWSGVPLPSPKNLHSIHLISRWTCSLSESTSRAAVKYLRVGSKYESQQATRWDWLPAAGDCPPRQQGDFQETPSIMS